VLALLLKPTGVLLSPRYWYTYSFSRTTLAEPGRLGLCLNFPEPYKASNLKIFFSTAKTLQNSEIYHEIDTATLKCQVKIHISAIGSLTAAMEEDTNQTSRQSGKWRIFHVWKMYLSTQSTLGDTGSLNEHSAVVHSNPTLRHYFRGSKYHNHRRSGRTVSCHKETGRFQSRIWGLHNSTKVRIFWNYYFDSCIAWENRRHFTRSSLEAWQNDVWVTSVEIPYWWGPLPISW